MDTNVSYLNLGHCWICCIDGISLTYIFKWYSHCLISDTQIMSHLSRHNVHFASLHITHMTSVCFISHYPKWCSFSLFENTNVQCISSQSAHMMLTLPYFIYTSNDQFISCHCAHMMFILPHFRYSSIVQFISYQSTQMMFILPHFTTQVMSNL